MTYLIVYNPHSGRKRIRHAWHAVHQELAPSHTLTRLDLSKHRLPPRDELVDYDALILIGGDGTLRSIVEHLRHERVRVPIGIVPIGSANVLAKSLGVPRSPKQAARLVASGKTVTVDIGLLSTGHYVLSTFALGYLSERVLAVSQRLKRTLGFGGYLVSFATQTRLPLHSFTMTVDGHERTVAGHSLFIVNAASVFGVHSKRTVDFRDGQFELVVTTNKKFRQLPALAFDFYFRRTHPKHFVLLRGSHFTVHVTPDMKSQIDGEPFLMHGAVTLEVVPRQQEFFVG